MRKLMKFGCLIAIILFMCSFYAVIGDLRAESVEVEETLTQEETHVESEEIAQNEEVVETPTETQDPQDTQEEEITEETIKAKIEGYLANFMSESMVAKIIGWLVDAGVLGALLGIYLKYRKYKHNSLEDVVKSTKEMIDENLQKSIDNLSKEKIDKLVKSIETLEQANETIMKVLVLMQDNTSKGKVALLEYLGSKTQNEEVKEAVKDTQEELENALAKKEEVQSKVKDEYKEIF